MLHRYKISIHTRSVKKQGELSSIKYIYYLILHNSLSLTYVYSSYRFISPMLNHKTAHTHPVSS